MPQPQRQGGQLCNPPVLRGRAVVPKKQVPYNSPVLVGRSGGTVVGTATMGKVLVPARLENVYDLHETSLGSPTRRGGPTGRCARRPGGYRGLHPFGAQTASGALGLKALRSRQAHECRPGHAAGVRDRPPDCAGPGLHLRCRGGARRLSRPDRSDPAGVTRLRS